MSALPLVLMAIWSLLAATLRASTSNIEPASTASETKTGMPSKEPPDALALGKQAPPTLSPKHAAATATSLAATQYGRLPAAKFTASKAARRSARAAVASLPLDG